MFRAASKRTLLVLRPTRSTEKHGVGQWVQWKVSEVWAKTTVHNQQSTTAARKLQASQPCRVNVVGVLGKGVVVRKKWWSKGDNGWWSQAGGAKKETVLVEQWAGGANAGGPSSRVVLGEQGERKGATTRTVFGSNLLV